MPIRARLGSIRNVDDIRAHFNGSRRQVTDVYARLSGSIQLVWQLFTVDLSSLHGNTIQNTEFTSSGTEVTSTASLQLLTDGDGNAYTVWGRPIRAGIGSKYHARLTVLSGEPPTGGDSTGTWLSLGSVREWSLSVTASGFAVEEGQWRIQISRDGGATVLDSADFTIRAEIQTI